MSIRKPFLFLFHFCEFRRRCERVDHYYFRFTSIIHSNNIAINFNQEKDTTNSIVLISKEHTTIQVYIVKRDWVVLIRTKTWIDLVVVTLNNFKIQINPLNSIQLSLLFYRRRRLVPFLPSFLAPLQ